MNTIETLWHYIFGTILHANNWTIWVLLYFSLMLLQLAFNVLNYAANYTPL